MSHDFVIKDHSLAVTSHKWVTEGSSYSQKLELNILGQMFTRDRSADDFDWMINKFSHRILSSAQRKDCLTIR